MRIHDLSIDIQKVSDLFRQERYFNLLTVNAEIFVRYAPDSFQRLRKGNFLCSIDGEILRKLYMVRGDKVSCVKGSDLLRYLVYHQSELDVLVIGGDNIANQVWHSSNTFIEHITTLPLMVNDSGWIVDKQEELVLLKSLTQVKPHIVFVCLGSPKQEEFLINYSDILAQQEVNFAVGGGASWDFISGTQKRAPNWVCKIGLEWLYRVYRRPNHIKRVVNAIRIFKYI